MNKRYQVYMNKQLVGAVDNKSQLFLLIGCTKQHYYQTLRAKIEGEFTFRGNTFEVVDVLNPK